MKESGLILLQTIPASIDIEEFKRELTRSIKDIINVHDLHIWQLTANKSVCTAHIIFENPEIFTKVKAEIDKFFEQQGITIVTIQPEFLSAIDSETVQKPAQTCLVQCRDRMCKVKYCCKTNSIVLSSKSSLNGPSRDISSARLPELTEVNSIKTEFTGINSTGYNETDVTELENSSVAVTVKQFDLEKVSTESAGEQSMNEPPKDV